MTNGKGGSRFERGSEKFYPLPYPDERVRFLLPNSWNGVSTIPNLATTGQKGTKIGKEGDYYTSPCVHPLFGYLIAKQLSSDGGDIGRRQPLM